MTQLVRVARSGTRLAVHLRDAGAARAPLLLVHGFPFDHSMWSHQVAALAGWRCIAPDLRGAGGSDAPAGGYSMASYAEDLCAVCEALDVTAAVCCGFSMGGYVLFELLRRRPERVRALILCDTRAEGESTEGKRARDEQVALVRREGVKALADRLAPKLLGRTSRSRSPEMVEQVRVMIGRQSRAGVIGALGAMRDRPDSTTLLGAIGVPTLVLHGTEDEVAAPTGARELAGRIPGARYVEIAEAGHLAPFEQPDRVVAALREFLGGL